MELSVELICTPFLTQVPMGNMGRQQSDCPGTNLFRFTEKQRHSALFTMWFIRMLCLLELIVDTVCTTKQTVRISGDDKPAEVVRSRFLKLDSEHIRFVVSCMKENTTKIKNIRQYLLATLYNASLTMTSYYAALVQHDMAEGRI